jgi:hypothetical protein
MMLPINRALANWLFGEQPEEAMKENRCVNCKKPATEFRDEASKKEYSITALCQMCQDEVFESEE